MCLSLCVDVDVCIHTWEVLLFFLFISRIFPNFDVAKFSTKFKYIYYIHKTGVADVWICISRKISEVPVGKLVGRVSGALFTLGHQRTTAN